MARRYFIYLCLHLWGLSMREIAIQGKCKICLHCQLLTLSILCISWTCSCTMHSFLLIYETLHLYYITCITSYIYIYIYNYKYNVQHTFFFSFTFRIDVESLGFWDSCFLAQGTAKEKEQNYKWNKFVLGMKLFTC